MIFLFFYMNRQLFDLLTLSAYFLEMRLLGLTPLNKRNFSSCISLLNTSKNSFIFTVNF